MGIFDFFKRKSKDNQPLLSYELRQLLSSEVRQAIREELNASGLLQNKSTKDVKDDDSKSREYVHQIASLLRKHIIVEPVQDTRKMS